MISTSQTFNDMKGKENKFRFMVTLNSGKRNMEFVTLEQLQSGLIDNIKMGYDHDGDQVITCTYAGQYSTLNIGKKEVFEGDVIEYDKHLYAKEIEKRIGLVKFYDGGFKINHVDLSGIVNESGDVTFRPKVIGNIHENPELLK